MSTNFISCPGHKTINLKYIVTMEYIGSIDASMLGEFIIQNHSDGNAYIKFVLSNNEVEFWAFENEKKASTEYQKIIQNITPSV